MQTRGPLVRVVLPGEVPAWVVTDTAVLKQMLVDARLSTDAHTHWSALREGQITSRWVLWPWVAVQRVLTAAGPDHLRLRGILGTAFAHRSIQDLRPRIETITHQLLDQLARTPANEIADLRTDFARVLSLRVLCELLGLPPQPTTSLLACSTAIFDTTLLPEFREAPVAHLYRTLDDLIGDKRTNPGDDLTTALLSVYDDGNPPSEQELRDILLVTITAGHGTTAHLLENAALALLTDAALRADVLAGQRSWPTVIEETLRAQPPTVHLPFRFATDDIELDRGQRVAKGEVILTGLAAVDRHPHIHRKPARFDPRRNITDHLAISNSPRVCPGEPLARLVASIALPALFTRFPDLTLATPPGRLDYITSIVDNSHLGLPVFPHPWRR